MQRLTIELGARSYPIVIGPGLIDDAGEFAGAIAARDVLVVTNEVVGPLYLDRLLQSLDGRRVASVRLPDGEQHKTLEMTGRIFDALVQGRMNRDACVVALGGGVVGDMAGFAAACYQRGVDFVQVPTTLLAQVDSSVGGKTGVNHPGGKNLIGAFHQPRAVLSDTTTLGTLPPRELRAGLAEVIKYGLVADAGFLDWLDANTAALLALEPAALAFAIRRSCEIKAAIVSEDEYEHGRRALLNLGHTFGRQRRLSGRCPAGNAGRALRRCRLSALPGTLAPYAQSEASSRGRRFAEPPPRHRTEYQRDRDRIVHSTAFRRLVYKTQVFVNHEGDLYRTRLTHSLEVAQIARSVARALALNEPLAEAICLAHDLGHTPFGHAGQDALHDCMREFGGFEHNLQSLRVVDELEERYAEFPGLNLTFETREGILKHCSAANARRLGELGQRFLERRQPSLEAQLSNLADEIAYNNHDVDDGIRAGLISIDELREVAIFRRQYDLVTARYPGLGSRRLVHEVVRRMIDFLVNDLIAASEAAIARAAPADVEAVRSRPEPLLTFGDEVRAEHLELKQYLRRHLYRHYKVLRMTTKARRVMNELFQAMFEETELMPTEHQEAAQRMEAEAGAPGRARAVADYIAGMTDRFAILEHQRLFDPSERT